MGIQEGCLGAGNARKGMLYELVGPTDRGGELDRLSQQKLFEGQSVSSRTV